MSSHLDTISGDLRRSVKDLHFSSNNATETAVHHIYANTATRRPSASITQMDSVRSDDSDIGSPDYMSDVSSGAPEIVVWSGEVDRGDMESDEDVLSSPEALPGSPPPGNELNQSLLHDRLPASHPSSTSALSDLSELSSIPSTHSSQATTPNTDPSTTKTLPPAPMRPQRSAYLADLERPEFAVLPKSSIPTDIPLQQYAAECIMAAEESRLNPYALHPEEYHLLRHHISHNQVTTYLNIRNGILRMWLREPWRAVARKAAVGCANARWYDAASVCYDWLVRRGYINFGCVNYDVPTQEPSQANATKRRKTVAVVGAGISGLGCARQLDGLFQQYASRFWDRGEEPPKVIILEGRSRVGGRVYSREFKTKPAVQDPEFQGKRHTAEMGGMIITGFDRGNPMNILVRGQLGLPYHALTPETTIYDSNGKPVDPDRDQLVEKLYNDCLDRVSEYKTKTRPHKVIEGNRDLIEDGRDSHGDGSKTIIEAEEARAALPHAQSVAEQSVPEPPGLVPVSSDRVTGRSHNEPGVPATTNASDKAQSIGFDVNFASAGKDNVDLNQAAASDGATLGSVLDNAITQYKHLVDLNALDHRLVNWHVANLEYSNATNLNNLSLGLWDIDAGNEFDGSHTMVVGGYQSVARGLLQCPKPLEIRTQAAATKIFYTNDHFKGPVTIDCEDGTSIDADAVVCTVPLGVLKKGNVVFEPELPSWKTGAIDRLGFGALNKVVLVYDKVFWDPARHIFGVLQDAPSRNSTTQQEYGRNRGRFFQWFNISSTTGLPCLLALMAGDAGFDTEHTSNDVLVAEATQILRGVFGNDVPYPVEAVVTRWGSDRFARGSYSSAAPGMLPDDYDSMARSVGNLFFAGEHTIGTHPATVHGAFLSGLRAASEVLEAMLGPIEVPTPLVLPKDSLLVSKRKAPAQDPRQARLEAYEWEIWDHIVSKIGDRPSPPAKVAGNAYLLFSKAHFEEAKRKCEENRKHSKGRSMANEVRVMTSKMWKDATPEQRRPFEEQVLEQKRVYAEALQKYEEVSATWNKEASALRTAYEKDHPSIPGAEELAHEARSSMKHRRARNIHYGEDESDGEL